MCSNESPTPKDPYVCSCVYVYASCVALHEKIFETTFVQKKDGIFFLYKSYTDISQLLKLFRSPRALISHYAETNVLIISFYVPFVKEEPFLCTSFDANS